MSMSIKEAPVLHPTEEQWRDPIHYIETVMGNCDASGIVRIVPPPEFRPPFVLDKAKLGFFTRVQHLNKIEPNARLERFFMEKLRRFLFRRGTPLIHNQWELDHSKQQLQVPLFPIPRPLDESTSIELEQQSTTQAAKFKPNLFRLFKAVVGRGGFSKIRSQVDVDNATDSTWSDIARDALDPRVFSHKKDNDPGFLSRQIRALHDVYNNLLHDYERAIVWNEWPERVGKPASKNETPLNGNQNGGSGGRVKKERTVEESISQGAKAIKQASRVLRESSEAIEKARKMAAFIQNGTPLTSDIQGLMLELDVLSSSDISKIRAPCFFSTNSFKEMSTNRSKVTLGMQFWKYFPDQKSAWPGYVESLIPGSDPPVWRVRFTSRPNFQFTKSNRTISLDRRPVDTLEGGGGGGDSDSSDGRPDDDYAQDNRRFNNDEFRCQGCGRKLLQKKRLDDHLRMNIDCDMAHRSGASQKSRQQRKQEALEKAQLQQQQILQVTDPNARQKRRQRVPGRTKGGGGSASSTSKDALEQSSQQVPRYKDFVEKIEQEKLVLLISCGTTSDEAENAVSHGICQVCSRANNLDTMLICDGCEFGFHIACLNPPLSSIPEGDWFCPLCLEQESKKFPDSPFWRDNYKGMLKLYEGFESEDDHDHGDDDDVEKDSDDDDFNLKPTTSTKRTFSPCIRAAGPFQLKTFGHDESDYMSFEEYARLAEEFKTKYFSLVKEANEPMSNDERETFVEREFWKILAAPSSTPFLGMDQLMLKEGIKPHYGSDIDTGVVGSGFPTRAYVATLISQTSVNAKLEDVAKLHTAQIYAEHGWNVTNFPLLKGSFLQYIDADITGVITPWLYIGMSFSSFSWHTEDENFNSINYLHWGEPKSWWGVPGSEAEKFEKAAREIAPELFEARPDLLTGLITMFNPEDLVRLGVPVYHTIQHAGEYVITFPRAYHGGFNHGLNCAEAVNFATSNWLPFGKLCQERYKVLKKNPVIAYDSLLCKIAIHAIDGRESIYTAKHLVPSFYTLIQEQKQGRESVKGIVSRVIGTTDVEESNKSNMQANSNDQEDRHSFKSYTPENEQEQKESNYLDEMDFDEHQQNGNGKSKNAKSFPFQKRSHALLEKLNLPNGLNALGSVVAKMALTSSSSATSKNKYSSERQRTISKNPHGGIGGNNEMMKRTLGLAKIFGDLPQCFYCKSYCPISHVRPATNNDAQDNSLTACLQHAHLLKEKLETLCALHKIPSIKLELVEFFSISHLEEIFLKLSLRAIEVARWRERVRRVLAREPQPDNELSKLASPESEAPPILEWSKELSSPTPDDVARLSQNPGPSVREQLLQKKSQNFATGTGPQIPLEIGRMLLAFGAKISSDQNEDVEPLSSEIRATENFLKRMGGLLPNSRKNQPPPSWKESYSATLENVKAVLSEGQHLVFTFSPPSGFGHMLEPLRNLVQRSEQWELKVESALQKSKALKLDEEQDQDVVTLQSLLDEMNNEIQLELRNRSELCWILQEREWVLGARQILKNLATGTTIETKNDNIATLTQAEGLIDAFRKTHENSDQQIQSLMTEGSDLRRISEAIIQTRDWVTRAERALQEGGPDEFEILYTEYATGLIPLRVPVLFSEVTKRHQEVSKWIVKVREVLAIPSMDEKMFEKLSKLAAEIPKVGINPQATEIATAMQLVSDVQRWKSRMAQCFLSKEDSSETSSSLTEANELTFDEDNRFDRHLLQALRGPNPPDTEAMASTSPKKGRDKRKRDEDDAADDTRYCICRGELGKGKKDVWIACDQCGEWYHHHCVGLSDTDIDKIDKYICVRCADPPDTYKFLTLLPNPSRIRPLFCKCRMPYLSDHITMVACDKCDQWFHPACIGVVQPDAVTQFQASDKPFFCEECCSLLDIPFIKGIGFNGYEAKIKEYRETAQKILAFYTAPSPSRQVKLSVASSLLEECPLKSSSQYELLKQGVKLSQDWCTKFLSYVNSSKYGISLSGAKTLDLWDLCESSLSLTVQPPSRFMRAVKIELWYRFVCDRHKTNEIISESEIAFLRRVAQDDGFHSDIVSSIVPLGSTLGFIAADSDEIEDYMSVPGLVVTDGEAPSSSSSSSSSHLSGNKITISYTGQTGEIVLGTSDDQGFVTVCLDDSHLALQCPVGAILKPVVAPEKEARLISLRRKLFETQLLPGMLRYEKVIKTAANNGKRALNQNETFSKSLREELMQAITCIGATESEKAELGEIVTQLTLAESTRSHQATAATVRYCVCQILETEDRLMVACDAEKPGCKQWFHPECVGLDPNNLPASYICNHCLRGYHGKRGASR